MKRSLLVVAALGLSSQAFAGACGSVSSIWPSDGKIAINFYTLGSEKNGQAMLQLTTMNLLVSNQAVGNKNVILCLSDDQKSIISVQSSDTMPK